MTTSRRFKCVPQILGSLRIFDLYSQISKAVYSLQEIVHLNTIFAESVKYLPMYRVVLW